MFMFSENAIIQALNFNEQLRFCTFSIQIHVVNFDPIGLIWHALIKKIDTCCTFGLLNNIFMKYEGRKTRGRDKLNVRVGEGSRL